MPQPTTQDASPHRHCCQGAPRDGAGPASAIDPVCGMTVNRETARYKTNWNGKDFFLLLAALPRQIQGGARALSGAGVRSCPGSCPGAIGNHLHLPDASPDPPGGTGQLSDLRHGAGTSRADGGNRPEPRADGHDQALLDRPGVFASRRGPGDGRPRHGPQPSRRTADGQLDPVGPGDAGSDLGWLAAVCPRLGLRGLAQPQHVHAHRHGNRRLLALQRGRNTPSRHFSAGLPRRGPGRSLFRSCIGHHGAGPAGTGSRTARARAHGRGYPRPAESRARNGVARQRWRRR